MGDVVRLTNSDVVLAIDAVASAPIKGFEMRNALENLEVFQPFSDEDLGRRIRVIWEGSKYRGRGRETIWEGNATLEDNAFERMASINQYDLDKRFERSAQNIVEWTALTEEQCRAALLRLRWPDGFVCPCCGHRGHCVLAGRGLYQCNRCKKQTSLTAGTIFHAIKLPLTLWFAGHSPDRDGEERHLVGGTRPPSRGQAADGLGREAQDHGGDGAARGGDGAIGAGRD